MENPDFSLSNEDVLAFVFTRDRPALLPFYRDVLGLRLISEDQFGAMFALPSGILRLTDIADHEPSPHSVLGWGVKDIASASAILADRGVTFEHYEGFGQGDFGIWTAPDGKTRINWFKDTEGNLLSLTQRG